MHVMLSGSKILCKTYEQEFLPQDERLDSPMHLLFILPFTIDMLPFVHFIFHVPLPFSGLYWAELVLNGRHILLAFVIVLLFGRSGDAKPSFVIY